MTNVKWIKLNVNVFDDEKFDAIRTLPDSNDLQLAWVKLLCLAGTCNENGFLILTNEIPYTDEMLASRFHMDVGVVQRAMLMFQKLNMIEVVDNAYMVSNWLKYQSGDRLEELKEANRERQKRYRDKQRALNLIPIKGEKCVYCGNDAESVDHIIPKIKGGIDNASNLVPVCISCNCSKKDKDLVDFLNDDLEYGKRLNHELIRQNDKIMSFVEYVPEENRYRNVTVTQREYVTPSISLSYSFSKYNNIYNLYNLLKDDNYKDKEYYKSNNILLSAVKDWMSYKDERTPKKSNHYTERGMKSLLSEIKKYHEMYGDDPVVETINHTIAGQWQGIVWDWMEKKFQPKQTSAVSDAVEEEDEEIQELRRLGYQ